MELETVWNGSMNGIYLGALRGQEPYRVYVGTLPDGPSEERDPTPIYYGRPSRPLVCIDTRETIVRLLSERGPMTHAALIAEMGIKRPAAKNSVRMLIFRMAKTGILSVVDTVKVKTLGRPAGVYQVVAR